MLKTTLKSNKKIAIGLAIVAILLWSTVASVFKLGLRHYSPYQLVFLASISSAIALLILSLIFNRKALVKGISTKREFSLTLSQALLNPFLYYNTLLAGYKMLPAQIAQPINFTWPIFLSVFAVLFIGEKFTRNRFLALIISFIGVVVVSANGNFSGSENTSPSSGVILCLLSAVIWALYWILNMRDARLPLVKLTWGFSISVLCIWVYGLITGNTMPKLEWPFLVYPVYIGLFEMSITFLIWITALEKAKNTVILSNMVYLIPVLSLGVIWVVLNESIKITTVIGLTLIVCGVVIQSRLKQAR